MALSPKRKGDLAELHVASILLSDPLLEVFVAACDEGHGEARRAGPRKSAPQLLHLDL